MNLPPPSETERQSAVPVQRMVRHRERIVTEALGFRLKLEITVGELDVRGRHKTHEDEHGQTCDEHRIELRDGLSGGELAEVAAHEAYHLLYSVRNRITADEETEAEVFGHLVKRLYEAAQMPNGDWLHDKAECQLRANTQRVPSLHFGTPLKNSKFAAAAEKHLQNIRYLIETKRRLGQCIADLIPDLQRYCDQYNELYGGLTVSHPKC